MNYLILGEQGLQHFYYKDNEGIRSAREKNIFLPETIFKDGQKPFCVYDEGGILHIICVNEKNELIYIANKDGAYKTYMLSELKDTFSVQEMKICASGERLNLLCSVRYDGDILLIHCILGNMARPSVIDKMGSSYFFAFGDKVYYTNQCGVLGFQDLADGKPDRFVSVVEDAEMPYLYFDGTNEYIVYKKGNTIYINHRPVVEDAACEGPVLTMRGGKLILIWKSGAVLKYTAADNNDGEPPKRIVSTGEAVLYSIQENENIHYDYAAYSEGRPYFPEGFAGEKTTPPDSNYNEVRELIQSVVRLKEEVRTIEKRIKTLKQEGK